MCHILVEWIYVRSHRKIPRVVRAVKRAKKFQRTFQKGVKLQIRALDLELQSFFQIEPNSVAKWMAW